MEKKGMSRGRSIGLLLFVSLVLLMAMARPVYAETKLTEEMLTEIGARLDRAVEAGEAEADLSDMDIIVNMYSDRFSEEYQKVLDICDDCRAERACFTLGSHKETYAFILPETEPVEGSNEYGVGPNKLMSIGIDYDDYYSRPDGSADVGLIARTQEKLTKEYDVAMSVVSDEMSDVEKALALYDYIIAVSNYPPLESIGEDGVEVYDSESYSGLSVFRDHISVCVANATAYCYLLSDCGIPCIRVDSDAMHHSWTMLQVGGAWYHADPTWDNPRYMEGYTGRWDQNNDIWDLGAASHIFFLKSDDEMTDGLGHYGWSIMADYTKDGSVDKLPESGPSGSFDDTFFGINNPWQEEVHYNYVDGEWYFLNRSANKIVRTAYGQAEDEARYIDAPSEQLMKYVYGGGGCLFICEDDGIWRYDIKSGEMGRLPLAENSAGNEEPIFTEMNTASGALNGVVMYPVHPEDPGEEYDIEFDFVEFSYPLEEVLAMEIIAGTEEEATTEAGDEDDPQEKPAMTETVEPETETAIALQEDGRGFSSIGLIGIGVLIGLAAAAVINSIILRGNRRRS